MPRIVVEAPKGKVTQDGEVALRLRISYAGHRRFIPLPYRVRYKDWNPKKREVRKNHPDHLKLNNELQNALEQATSSVLDLRARGVILTADRIKDAVAGQLDGGSDRYSNDFLVYARERVEDYRRRGQYPTYERLMSTVRKVEAMLVKQRRNATLSFAEVDVRFLNDFETYCIEVRGNKPNTVSKSLKGIRTIYYKAIREGIVSQADNPFFHITMPERPGTKERLTEAEIERMRLLELDPESKTRLVRDAFLFAVYTGGMRFGDVCLLRWTNFRRDGDKLRLAYRMSKSQKERDLAVVPAAEAVLVRYERRRDEDEEAYVFPFLDAYDLDVGRPDPERLRRSTASQTTLANKTLKEVASLAGIQKHVTTHVARHTFADLARKKGWGVYDISKALAHSKLRETEVYLASFDHDALDEKMEALF